MDSHPGIPSSAGFLDLIEHFELTWQQKGRATIEPYLVHASHSQRQELLVTLANIELEYRLKSGERVALGEYFSRYPALGGEDRFPHLAPELRNNLAANEDSPRPRRMGDYELLEEIGRGGMGVVYRARQVSLNRVVALKMIKSGVLATDEQIKRFRGEAEAVAQLRHPNIVTVHDFGQLDGVPYLAMEHVEGRTLAELIHEHRLPCRTAVEYAIALAEAVEEAHAHGILHRDLKPSNVIVDPKGRPYIMDFGLARRIDSDVTRTSTGTIMGSPAYMAPEQASGDVRGQDARTDVWAMGVMLYEMLTGQRPFGGEDITHQILHGKPARPRTIDATIPPELELICLKCLSKKKSRRFASAANLAAAVRRCASAEGEPRAARPHTRIRGWAAAISMGAIVLTSLVACGVSYVAAPSVSVQRNQEYSQPDSPSNQPRPPAPDPAQPRHDEPLAEFQRKYEADVRLHGPMSTPAIDARLRLEDYKQFQKMDFEDRERCMSAARLDKKIALLEAERPREAIECAGEALNLRTQLWGAEHHRVAASMDRLGGLYEDIGEYELALPLYVESLEIREKAYGENHPLTAVSLNNLALLYTHIGEYDWAKPRYLRALAIYKAEYGERHREYALTRNNLGLLYTYADNYEGAELNLRHALDIFRELEQDIHVAMVLHNLGFLHARKKQYEKAEAFYREALQIRRSMLGTRNLLTAHTMINLADVLRHLGNSDEAKSLQDQGRATRTEILGE